MSPMQIELLIARIMNRRSASSGTAVFIDPIILRELIESVLNGR